MDLNLEYDPAVGGDAGDGETAHGDVNYDGSNVNFAITNSSIVDGLKLVLVTVKLAGILRVHRLHLVKQQLLQLLLLMLLVQLLLVINKTTQATQ